MNNETKPTFGECPVCHATNIKHTHTDASGRLIFVCEKCGAKLESEDPITPEMAEHRKWYVAKALKQMGLSSLDELNAVLIDAGHNVDEAYRELFKLADEHFSKRKES